MAKPNKQERKQMKKQWAAQQRSKARAKLPLPNEKMQAMFDMLDLELPCQPCDHSLQLVRRWLSEQGLPEEQVVAWLQENGGYCDCEALANAEGRWQDAIGDVSE